MRRPSQAKIIAAFFALAAPALAAPPQVSAPPQMGYVLGRVSDFNSGAPIPKAKVTITFFSPTGQAFGTRSVESGPDGSYKFPLTSAGKFVVFAQKEGYQQASFGEDADDGAATPLSIDLGQTLKDVDIKLIALGTISGVVIDEDHVPISGLQLYAVQLHFLPGAARNVRLIQSAVSDKSGAYAIENLRPGTYYVLTSFMPLHTATADSAYVPVFHPASLSLAQAEPVRVRAGAEVSDTNIVVAARPSFAIHASIVEPDPSQPRPNYSVSLVRDEPGDPATSVPLWTSASSDANSDGRFTIPAVPPGAYTIQVSSRIQATSRPPRVGPSSSGRENFAAVPITVQDSDLNLDIQMPPSSEFRGALKLEGQSDLSFEGFRFSLSPAAPLTDFQQVRVNKDGAFDFQNLSAGRYSLSILRPGDATWYVSSYSCSGLAGRFPSIVDLDAGVTTDCTVTLKNDAGSLSGRVKIPENAPFGVEIVAISADASLPHYTRSVRAERDGTYQLQVLIPGDYDVFAVPADDLNSYLDPRFDDRNQAPAQRLSIQPRQSSNLDLQLTIPR